MSSILKKFFVCSLFCTSISVDAYADPGACTGDCWSHDPCVIQRSSDGVYFRFDTGGAIPVRKSSSLSGSWTLEGNVLTDGSSISISGNDGSDAWAPDVHLVGSTYYLYYAISSFGSQTSSIGVATSTTLEVGSWTDHGATGIASTSSKAYNAIDPNLITVGSSYYLNFGSFWGDIYQVQMASPPLKGGGGSSYNIAYNSSGSHSLEGSFMFYYSSYYYLFISSGACCNYDTDRPAAGDEYRIIMCRSTSATGSFVDKDGKACTAGGGSTLLKSHGTTYGPGGQGVFTDSSLGPVLYYHYINTDNGYTVYDYLFGWNALSWSDGWPSV